MKISTTLLIRTGLILLAAGFIFCACSKDSGNEFKNGEFSFIPPDGWSVTEKAAETVVYYEKKIYELQDSGFNPVISVSGGDNPDKIQKTFLEDTQNILSKAIPDYKLVFAGNYLSTKHKRLIYTGVMGETLLKWDMIFFIKGKKSYILTYTCQPEDYESCLDAFTVTADSFKLR